MNPTVIIFLSFASSAGLVYVVSEAKAHQSRRLWDRLDQLRGRLQTAPPVEAASDAERPDALPTLTRWLGGFEPRLRLAMLRADLRLRPAEWAALCLACPAAAFLLGLLATRRPADGLLLGLVGAALPPVVLGARRSARRRRFDTQLPDALMLLTSALRAGYSFPQAMQTVAEELPPPLAAEFAWASGEAKLGVPLETALGRIVGRVQSPDLDLVVTAILIQLPLGGNLAEVLDAIADTIRERVRVSGEVQTLTAEGRLSAVILIVLAPTLALILHLRDPAYFQPLLSSPVGHLLVVGAIVGQIVGGLIIHRMVALDV